MKVWDCFPFWNEFDLLNCRLHELDGLVTHVLIEGDRTFQGRPKSLYFAEQQECYREYADRLCSFKVTLPEHVQHPMQREAAQRNGMIDALKHLRAEDDDIVIINDADELIGRHAVHYLQRGIQSPVRLGVKLYHYWLNLRIVMGSGLAPDGLWYSPIAVRVRDLTSMMPHDWRTRGVAPRIPNCGWSFSFLGDVQSHQAKLAAWSHHEWNVSPYNTTDNIARARATGTDWDVKRNLQHRWVALDESYPRYILDNPAQFAKYVGKPSE